MNLCLIQGTSALPSFHSGKYLWNKTSILKDIHLLSKAREKKFSGVAVVCGGSIAGLFAARVCANHFEKVLIVEPEEWVAVGKKGLEDHRGSYSPKRSRVAQYTAYHHFQPLITSAMRQMFGSQRFEQALRDVGARLATRCSVFWVTGIPALPPPGPKNTYPPVMNLTRPVFETMLRRLVLQTCKGVQYLNGFVSGLIYDDNSEKITGVFIKSPDGCSTTVKGDLVIDATGSFMGGYRWLKAIPAFANRSSSLNDLKISFNPNVSYTTSGFALPPKIEEEMRKYGFPTNQDTDATSYGSFPLCGAENRTLFIEKRDKNFLHVVCGGYGWSDRIRSVADIEEFVKNLHWKQLAPHWISELLQTFQRENVPVSFVHSKFGSSVYIKYHEASDYLPSNFVAVGDAYSQTNPVLGQGCPKACAHAIVLSSQLHRVPYPRISPETTSLMLKTERSTLGSV